MRIASRMKRFVKTAPVRRALEWAPMLHGRKNCYVSAGTHAQRRKGRSRQDSINHCNLPSGDPGCEGKGIRHGARGFPRRPRLEQEARCRF